MSKAFGGFDSHFKKKDPAQNANTQNPVHQGNNLSFSSPENNQPPNKLPSKVKPNPFANPPSFSNPMAIQPPSTSNNPFVIAKSNPPTNNLNLNAPPTNINKAFSPTTVPSLRTNSQTDATRAIVDTNTGSPSNPPKSDGQDKSISEVSTTQSIKDQFMLQLQSKQFTYPKTDNKNSIFHNRNVQSKVSQKIYQVQKPVFQDFLKNGNIKGNPFKKAGPNGETQDPHQPPSQPPPGILQNPIVVNANKVNTNNTSTTQILPNANTAGIQNNLQTNGPVAPVVPSPTQNTQNNKEAQSTSKPTQLPTSGQPQKANPFSSVRNNPYQNGSQSRPSPFSHKTNSLNMDKNKDKTNESNVGKDDNNKNNVSNNNNTNGNKNETNTLLTKNENVSPQNKDVSSRNNTNSVLANNFGPNLPEGTNVMSMFLKKPAAGNPNNNNANLNNNKLNFNDTDLSTTNNNANNNVLNNNNNSNNTTSPIINISFNNPNNTNTNATANNKSNNQPTSTTTTTTTTTTPGNPFPNKMGTANIFNNNAANPNNNTNATTTKLTPTLTTNPLTNTNTNIATAPLQPQYQQWPQHPPITDPMMMIQPMYIPFPNFNLNSSNPPPPPPEPEQPQQTNLLATNIANNTTTKTVSATNANNVFNTSKSVVETLLTDDGINANNWKKSEIVDTKTNTNNNVNNNTANNNTAITNNTNNTNNNTNTNTNNLFNNNNNNKLTTALFNNNTTNNNTNTNTNTNTNNKPVPTFFAKVNLPSTNKLLINVPKPQTNSIFNNDNNAFKNVGTQNNTNTEKKLRNENPDPNSLIDKYQTEDLFKVKAGVPKPAVAVAAPGFPSNLFTQAQPQTPAQPQDPNTNPGLRKPPRMYNQDGSLSNKVPSWKNILPQVKQSAAYKRFLTETIEQQQARLNGRQPQFFDKLKYKIHSKPANSGANVVWITEDDPTYQKIVENQTMKELERSIVEDEKNKRRQEVEMRKQLEVEEREKEEKERINRPPFYYTLPEDREEQKNEQQHENKEYRTNMRSKFKKPQQEFGSKINSKHANIILKHSSPSSSSSVSSSAFSLVTFYLTLIYLKQNQSKRQIQIQLPSSKLPSLSQNSAKELFSNYITKHSSQFRMKPSPLIDNIQIHLLPHEAKVSCIIQQRAINLNEGYQFTYQTVENDCQVTGLFIFNQFGQIFFPEKINVTNVNFYDAFEIMEGSFVMNTGKEFPRANEQLRREFVVKLYSCPYADKLRNEGERRKDVIEQKLAKFCKKKGFSFMDIDLETHHWRFKVSKTE